jgi:CxxC motif-containing protein (DUF1111 family)
MGKGRWWIVSFLCAGLAGTQALTGPGPNPGPGARTGAAAAGQALPGLTAEQLARFETGRIIFSRADSVTGSLPDTGGGLGPRYNLDRCAGCHSWPATGGSSPSPNPEIEAATLAGAQNRIPAFISLDGPVRVARFKFNPDGTRDGGVHDLYTITGRIDAPGASLAQPDFAAAAAQGNLIYRIPTPLYGAGLIESIPDRAIIANKFADLLRKAELRIAGQENRNGNDGTITRFGWKAQNKSILMFSGEAYSVEMGVANPLFPQERDESYPVNPTPEDDATFTATDIPVFLSDIENFTFYIRFLAAPRPGPATASSERGRRLFEQVGCSLCHTPELTTGPASVAAMGQVKARLFSDLLLHHMGQGLADDIVQGLAGPDQFRTAPLWGVGQRLYFLHDGRARDLLTAIAAHQSPGSEANWAIIGFNGLSGPDRQAILDLLGSL